MQLQCPQGRKAIIFVTLSQKKFSVISLGEINPLSSQMQKAVLNSEIK